ncbi:MAG: hypothetical protein B1H03_00645 [Planctomycetales bacterium 4484_113]|nr:MAG: hypothetical protein B1H03_00645 [Planctomycetales bacterium 4484_113]
MQGSPRNANRTSAAGVLAPPRRTRLLLFISSLQSGGTEQQMVYLLKHLDRNRFEVHLLTYYPENFFADQLEGCDVTYHYVPRARGRLHSGFNRRIAAFFRRERFDLVHSMLDGPNFYARLFARRYSGSKVITSLRNIRLARWKYPLEWFTRGGTDLVIANSYAVQDVLIHKLGYPENRTRVVYNGVDLSRFSATPYAQRASLREPLGWRREGIHLSYPVRICAHKNHFMLLRALKLLPANVLKQVFIHVMGRVHQPSYAQRFFAAVKGSGLSPHLIYDGEVRDVPQRIAASDACLLVSKYDGFSNGLLESWASARPSITCEVADVPRILKDWRIALSFPIDDDAAFAARIAEFVNMPPEARAQMGAEGRRYVEEVHTIEALVRNTVAVYDEVLSSSSAAAQSNPNR